MANVIKGKGKSVADKAKEAADNADAAIARSRAARTPQQVNDDQTRQDIKNAANRAELDIAHNAGQKAHDDRLADEEARWKEIEVFAVECGERLGSDKELDKYFAHIVKVRQDESMKPYDCMQFLEKLLTKEQMARLPWPKTEQKDMPAGSNQLFDKIKVYDGEKWIASSFYREMAKATPRGKAHADKRAEYNKSVAAKDGEHTKPELSVESAAVNSITRAMEMAGKLHIQIDRMKLVNNIEWSWEKDKNGSVLRTGMCIFMQEVGDRTKRANVTISQFCNFRISKDVVRKGTIKVLKESVKKKEDKKPVGKVDKYEQKTVGEMLQAFNAAINMYGAGGPMESTKRHAELTDMIGRQDSVRWTAWKIYNMLRPIMETDGGKYARMAQEYQDALDKAMTEVKPDATKAA